MEIRLDVGFDLGPPSYHFIFSAQFIQLRHFVSYPQIFASSYAELVFDKRVPDFSSSSDKHTWDQWKPSMVDEKEVPLSSNPSLN